MSGDRDPGPPAASGFACPLPARDATRVQLAHGGGGRLTRELIRDLFARAFDNPALRPLHDGALLDLPGTRLALSTDGFVVTPRFFPGGDIGSLAIHGTINDLAMCGAMPLALTAAFVIEEGLLIEELGRVVESMRRAAAAAGVAVVSGDTKVVDRGKGDGLYIATTGVGRVREGIVIAPDAARPGDAVLVSGALAEHGIAVMSQREGLEFETTIRSDSAALHCLVADLLAAVGRGVHVLRDPTRGGVAAALNEIAEASGAGIRLDEASLPVAEEVRGACEILGLDPLYVANEGKALAIVAPEDAAAALVALRAHPLGRGAARIGEVVADFPGRVFLRGTLGGMRLIDLLSGEMLPRIC